MDSTTSGIITNPVCTTNIVATAMSSANLSPTAGSPVRLPLMSTSPVGSHSPHQFEQKDLEHRFSPVSPNRSLQSTESMDIERKPPTPHNADDNRTHSPKPQESHPMMIDGENEKIVIIGDPGGQINKDAQSPMMAGSPISQKSQDGSNEMRSIVLINESSGSVSTVPVSKDGHLMPPSPAHTPQPPISQQMSTDNDHGVRALMVYNERGEPVADPIIQYVPNQNREDSLLMKEDSYPITCGNSKGELHWKKFICPGINAKCVLCHNVWMTPKEFVQEAGKSTLKDWKRAIRINGTMLRKMIESGDVDYYQHETNCSNQCRSNKGASLEATSSRESFNHSFDLADTKDHSMNEGPSLERSNSEDNTMLLNAKRAMLSVQRLSQESQKSFGGMSSLERSSSEDSGLAPSPQLDGMVMRESIATADKIQDLQAFWSGIIRTDLFDEVVQDVVSQVSSIQHRAKTSPIVSAEDAVMMTNLANALELIPTIAQKMATHKMTVERQAEQSNLAIQELERKLAEHKRYEIDLKRKSQHLESVINLTPNEKRKKKNMVRLYRQKAVEHQPGPSGQAGTSRLSAPDIVGVVPTNPLLRYPSEMWVPHSSSAVAHALQQVASNQIAQMNVSGRMISMPIPPHLLSTHDPSSFQVNQDSSKK
ncbi:glucocorticoid modulatory element-binding protein 1-like isoform X3 [Styela clava]|uniref:glucocorticoid modulatory element-binding protein 1-like isoform X3 n=1 Tax=Styela clava TaxID=7725 RepID=UPI00193A14DF|nr:glucocorticoid modulatory element-binding protein 1-like isoform X3 [Styela clava]